ncbi:MAG TPA: cellulase family glycosylhydrolase [Parafilimonas sp.]|nr:cellulase family glycosylhydrolase [Parafilimonas sp.]
MRSVLVCFLIVCSFIVNAQNFVTTKGKDLMLNEKPFVMKGINLGNWLVPEGYMFKFEKAASARLIQEVMNELIGPDQAKKFWQQYLHSYITEADIDYLKSIGVNSIRVPFNYRLFTNEDYLGEENNPNHGFEILDPLVQWCKKDNIYILLDMHCAPGGQTGDNIDDSYAYPFLYDDTAAQNETVSIWKRIADHYKNEKIILGYDLLNEPIPPFYDTGYFNPKLEPLYKKITAAVRTVDKNHLIFLGGAQWDSNFDVFGKPFDDKLVYTFHKYWTAPTREVVQSYINFRDKYNVPIYCGETGENTDEWISQFRQMLDSNNIGWHFWPYKKMDNSRCMVTFDKPENYDAISAFADTTRSTFEEVRKARPDMNAAKKSLEQFLINCRFENCRPNEGYVKALGFK